LESWKKMMMGRVKTMMAETGKVMTSKYLFASLGY
jgi:hypothetical protein